MNDDLMMLVLRCGAGVWCVWVVWMFYKTFTAPIEPSDLGQDEGSSVTDKEDPKS
jgi:hypothetical protein